MIFTIEFLKDLEDFLAHKFQDTEIHSIQYKFSYQEPRLFQELSVLEAELVCALLNEFLDERGRHAKN